MRRDDRAPPSERVRTGASPARNGPERAARWPDRIAFRHIRTRPGVLQEAFVLIRRHLEPALPQQAVGEPQRFGQRPVRRRRGRNALRLLTHGRARDRPRRERSADHDRRRPSAQPTAAVPTGVVAAIRSERNRCGHGSVSLDVGAHAPAHPRRDTGTRQTGGGFSAPARTRSGLSLYPRSPLSLKFDPGRDSSRREWKRQRSLSKPAPWGHLIT